MNISRAMDIIEQIIEEQELKKGNKITGQERAEIRKTVMDEAVTLEAERISYEKKLAALDELTALSEELGMTEATIADFEAMKRGKNEN